MCKRRHGTELRIETINMAFGIIRQWKLLHIIFEVFLHFKNAAVQHVSISLMSPQRRRLVDSKSTERLAQLGRPRCNLAAGWAAGEAQTLRRTGDIPVIWGQTGCGAHVLAADACTFHKLRRGPFVCILLHLCTHEKSVITSQSECLRYVPSGSRRDPLEPLRCRLSIHSNGAVALELKGRNRRERVLREEPIAWSTL